MVDRGSDHDTEGKPPSQVGVYIRLADMFVGDAIHYFIDAVYEFRTFVRRCRVIRDNHQKDVFILTPKDLIQLKYILIKHHLDNLCPDGFERELKVLLPYSRYGAVYLFRCDESPCRVIAYRYVGDGKDCFGITDVADNEEFIVLSRPIRKMSDAIGCVYMTLSDYQGVG